MSPAEERAFEICRRVPWEGKIVEVGVLIGALSRQIMRSRHDVSLAMVDNWLPMELQPASYIATNDDHALHDRARAERHYQEARKVERIGRGRSKIWRGDSTLIAKSFAAGSVDLVFLDADHSFEGVTKDLAAWLPAIKPGGFIGGHDYRNPDPRFRFGVTEAVDQWSASRSIEIEVGRNFTWFARV